MSWKRKLEKSWGRLGMKYKLSDICDIKIGRTPPRKESKWFNTGLYSDYTWVSIKDLGECNKYIDFSSETISLDGQEKFNIPIVKTGTILLSFKLTVGRVAIATKNLLTNEAIAQLPIKDSSKVDRDFLYYYLLRYPWSTLGSTSSIATAINSKMIKEMEVELPDILMQKKIANILSTFDEKINTNYDTNNNLLEQVLTLYRNRFIDTVNNKRRIFRADKYFDISIGKTPPRKEPQWFSTNPQDITWVSISDMGTCGLYISSSSEQLTREAVERHNVKIVPDNTILLSFKLTVGRIAITNGEMTTNEAIAHFKTDKKEINEYLYCYLKCFNYQTMGSTSSIATAVNSKIIKGMPFVVPTDDELIDFHSVAAPIFAKIKANQTESKNLTAVRDILLPKLMSGELDVSNIDI